MLDVTFREDKSRSRKEAAPENYAIFRHIALNITRRNTSIDASVKRKRHMAALNDDVRTTLIKGLNEDAVALMLSQKNKTKFLN